MIEASRTAERVAERRAAHQWLDVPPVFVDPIAMRILRPEVAARIRADSDDSRMTRLLRAFLVARSRYAEDRLRLAVERGVTQYVILGAGYDTFAYRNPFSNLEVYEIDHPATQAAKRQRLEDAGIAIPSNLTFVAADLAEQPLGEVLVQTPFERRRAAMFAWLGVLPYLERADVEQTLSAITSLASGTEIVFDYGIPRTSLPLPTRLVFDEIAKRVAKAGEPFKTFFAPEDLHAMLLRVGYREVEDLGPGEINAMYFAGREDGLRVGGAGRIVSARL